MKLFIHISLAIIILIVIYGIYLYIKSGQSNSQLNTPFQKFMGAAGQPSPKPPVTTNNSGRPIDTDSKVVHAGDKLKAVDTVLIYNQPTTPGLSNRVTTGWIFKTPTYIPANNFIGIFVTKMDDNWIKVAKFPEWNDLPDVYYVYRSANYTVEPYVI